VKKQQGSGPIFLFHNDTWKKIKFGKFKKLQDSTVASNCFPKYFCSIQVSLQDIYFLFFEFCSTANQLPSDYDSEMCVFSNCKWVMYYCKFAEYLNVVQILQFLIV
jgi:hypothetical protein